MRNLNKIIASLLLLFLAFGCNSDSDMDDMDPTQQLMVEAYVFANEPVNHIKLVEVQNDGMADPIPANDANVKISQGMVNVPLTLINEEEGIYGIADSQMVFSGAEQLILEVVYHGKTYKATTHFPPPIENLSITNEYVNATEALNDQLPLTTLSWKGPEGNHTYCIFSRGTESESMPSYPVQTTHNSAFYRLHDSTTLNLLPGDFTHIGSYQLYVSAVNQEYIQMYSGNSTLDLQGAPSNVEGAWGVFTAFNGLSVDITVE